MPRCWEVMDMIDERELFDDGREDRKISGPPTVTVRKQWPRTYTCPRCGGTLETFIDLAAGRCGCGGTFSLRPERREP